MKFLFLFVFVLIIVQTIRALPFGCPENADLKPVGGSTCYKQIPTCQDPTPKDVEHPLGMCTQDLIYRCWCNEGYLMDNGKCVLKENCPKN